MFVLVFCVNDENVIRFAFALFILYFGCTSEKFVFMINRTNAFGGKIIYYKNKLLKEL